MNNTHTRSRFAAQAPSPCTSPFANNLDIADRLERLSTLGAAVRLQFRHHPDLSDALVLAETTGGDTEWMSRAVAELARLPSPHRRRLLAGYATSRRS